MEKLNREEILCLIENIGDVAIMLGNHYIDVEVKNQKYNDFLTQLDIPDAKYIAEKYIRSVATTFDYKNDLKYTFKFDEITISSKILYKNESWYSHKIGLNENEIDMFIDNRFEENDDTIYNDDYAKEYNEEYDDTYDDFHCDDDYPCVDYDEEQAKYSSENTTEEDLVDSLNNDLDDCLSKEWFFSWTYFYYILEVITAQRQSVVKHIAVFNWKSNK